MNVAVHVGEQLPAVVKSWFDDAGRGGKPLAVEMAEEGEHGEALWAGLSVDDTVSLDQVPLFPPAWQGSARGFALDHHLILFAGGGASRTVLPSGIGEPAITTGLTRAR